MKMPVGENRKLHGFSVCAYRSPNDEGKTWSDSNGMVKSLTVLQINGFSKSLIGFLNCEWRKASHLWFVWTIVYIFQIFCVVCRHCVSNGCKFRVVSGILIQCWVWSRWRHSNLLRVRGMQSYHNKQLQVRAILVSLLRKSIRQTLLQVQSRTCLHSQRRTIEQPIRERFRSLYYVCNNVMFVIRCNKLKLCTLIRFTIKEISIVPRGSHIHYLSGKLSAIFCIYSFWFGMSLRLIYSYTNISFKYKIPIKNILKDSWFYICTLPDAFISVTSLRRQIDGSYIILQFD